MANPDGNCRTLRNLNLPAALDALEKPIGLPPSLLQKAEEVRSENGPQKVMKEIEDVGALAKRDADLLEDVRNFCRLIFFALMICFRWRIGHGHPR